MNEAPLSSLIRGRIATHGPLTVTQYMSLALGHPQHGYYMTRDPLGARGDFTTAPEISQMFGELIGLWAVATRRHMGMHIEGGKIQGESDAGKTPWHLIELGPGRGTLMADMVRTAKGATRGTNDFARGLEIHLVETSPSLMERQRAALADAGVPVFWHHGIGSLPPGPAIIIANEFFDALGIHQFILEGDQWRERLITIDSKSGAFAFTSAAATPPLAALGHRLPPPHTLAGGSIVEIAPAREEIAAALGERLARQGGAALFIDYGPSLPEFSHVAAKGTPQGGAENSRDGVPLPPLGESLQAVSHHGFADPLVAPGRVDLTSHVDFAALAAAARGAGARVYGPVEQGFFLKTLGIDLRAARLAAAAPGEAPAIAAAHERLTGPSAMGQLFKVMALAHPELPPPAGFEGVAKG